MPLSRDSATLCAHGLGLASATTLTHSCFLAVVSKLWVKGLSLGPFQAPVRPSILSFPSSPPGTPAGAPPACPELPQSSWQSSMAQSCVCCDPVSLDSISDRFSWLKRLFWLRSLLLSLQESALVCMPTPSFSEQGMPGMTEYLPPWLPVPLAGHAPVFPGIRSSILRPRTFVTPQPVLPYPPAYNWI